MVVVISYRPLVGCCYFLDASRWLLFFLFFFFFFFEDSGWLLLFPGGLEPAKASLLSKLRRHKGDKGDLHAKSANNGTW